MTCGWGSNVFITSSSDNKSFLSVSGAFAEIWGNKRFLQLFLSNNNNNFIDFIFDVKISVPEQSIQWQMKQSKIKVKKERK